MTNDTGHLPTGRATALAFAAICAVAFLAYANSLGVPFLFDDHTHILENPVIRSLWPPTKFFSEGMSNRPFINFSLAVNHAVSGDAVWSYHLVNVLAHALAACLLFLLAWRTLGGEAMTPRIRAAAFPAALGGALLWAAHPLNTQAVTYVIQRCESFMALFLLLLLYCALRGWEEPERRTRWHLAALACFVLGYLSKEVMAVAVVLVPAYQWVFRRASLSRMRRGSALLYVGMGAALVALLGLTIAARQEQTMLATHTPWQHLLTEPGVLLHYLRLAVWPHPLVFDYNWPIADFPEAWLPGLGVLALLGASLWGTARRVPAAYAGLWFFMLLAPSSTIVPLAPANEYRMYLPLAGLAVLFAVLLRCGLDAVGERFGRPRPARLAYWIVVVLLTAALAAATILRNQDYATEMGLWRDTLAKRPQSWQAHTNIVDLLKRRGRRSEALALMERAVAEHPEVAMLQSTYGALLDEAGRPHMALEHLRRAVELDPRLFDARLNLGIALARVDRPGQAEEQMLLALELWPGSPKALRNLALLMAQQGRLDEAVGYLERYREAEPDDPWGAQALERLRSMAP